MSKVINDEAEQQSAFERWEVPAIEEAAGLAKKKKEKQSPMTAEELEAVHKAAYEEGFALGQQEGKEQGYQEGMQAGREAGAIVVANEIQQLQQVIQALTEPLKAMDSEVEDSLVQLAMSVARQIIRREVSTEPGQVVAVVREAVAALPQGAKGIRISLHPDDAKLVRDALSLNDAGEQSWQVIDDPVITRGGCQIISENSLIDASIEKRIGEISARILGSERSQSTQVQTIKVEPDSVATTTDSTPTDSAITQPGEDVSPTLDNSITNPINSQAVENQDIESQSLDSQEPEQPVEPTVEVQPATLPTFESDENVIRREPDPDERTE